jgi:aminocarboxymuconate-semialdehyde decarboxylase
VLEPRVRTATTSIDAHAHFVDLDGARECARFAPDLAPTWEERDGEWHVTFPDSRARFVPRGLVDEGVRLADMDAQGVAVHALSGWTWLYYYRSDARRAAELVRIQNDAMLERCRAHPGRFVAIPGLPMQDADLAIAEVERLAERPEVVAVAIGTHVAGLNLDDDALEPIWEALDAADLPALVHPAGGVAGADRMKRYYLVNLIGNPVDSTIAIASVVCSGLLDRRPRLRFGFVHGGGFAPYQAGRWDHGWEVRRETKERIDRRPSEYFGDRIFFDSLTHDPGALEYLGTRWGWEHVFLGTDYPWDMATMSPIDDLTAAGLSPATVEQVASATPRAFLRWPATEPAGTPGGHTGGVAPTTANGGQDR